MMIYSNNGKSQMRNYGLDILKSIATIFIIFHHYQIVTGVVFLKGINYNGGNWLYWGNVVEFFFIVSGYLMFRYVDDISNERISLKDWYLKRALRLLPLVTVSVIVYEAIIGIHSKLCGNCTMCMGQNVNLWGAIITSLGLQNCGVFVNPFINNPVWYISVLIETYIVFYIVTILCKKFKIRFLYGYVFCVLLGCSVITYGISIPFLDSQIGRGWFGFFWGVILAMIVKRYGISQKMFVACILIVISFVCICLRYPIAVKDNIKYLLSFILFPALIFLSESEVSKYIFRHRVWGTWGSISYNAFIWHLPIQLIMVTATFWYNFTSWYNSRLFMYFICFLTEVIGAISYFMIEKPLDCILKNKLRFLMDKTELS